MSEERGDAKYIKGSEVGKQKEEKEVGSIEVKQKGMERRLSQTQDEKSGSETIGTQWRKRALASGATVMIVARSEEYIAQIQSKE